MAPDDHPELDAETARGVEGATADVLREISRSLIQIFKFQFGRGPEGISTRYAGADVIISVIHNSLTPVERSIRDMGGHQRLRDVRMLFQHATEPKFRGIPTA